jgi:hypothetical protein
MNRLAQYSRWKPGVTTFIFAAIVGILGPWVCSGPDRHSLRGALDAAARAVEAGDSRALFSAIDERGRAALAAIVKSRRWAARAIRADYPPGEREAVLGPIADAAGAADPEALFAQRCAAACRAELATQLGAPVSQVERDGDVEVRTTRGGLLRLHRGGDGAWGIVWHTAALCDERLRAARELRQIEANAKVYRRRRALEQSR